ncbi:hypothetical protein ACIBRY_28025 [Streptomyces anulatus]
MAHDGDDPGLHATADGLAARVLDGFDPYATGNVPTTSWDSALPLS